MVLHKKKTLNLPKVDTGQRRLFLEQLHQFEKDNRAIIFLDESGFKSHDNRPYGYSKKGHKCFGEYNWQLKNQPNAIGATYNNQLFAVGLYDCSVNSDVFHSWVSQLLLPNVPKNSVIVRTTQHSIKGKTYKILYKRQNILFYGFHLIAQI